MMAAHTNPRFLINRLKKSVCLIQKRNRVKTKWASTRVKLPSTELALQHFDMVYKNELRDLWPSVRLGLLSEQKYGALVNSYTSEVDEVISTLRSQGCRDFIKNEDNAKTRREAKDVIEPAARFSHFSSNIQCFVFPRGDISRFKPARPGSNGLLGYYLMDAASILPILALDIQQGDSVLDLCAGPGGKTLAILQTQTVRFLWANDASGSRTARLQRMLQSYIPKNLRGEDRIQVTTMDGRKWRDALDEHTFDRVLVDVPCTTDRHALLEDENNIFKRSRTKERQKLPLLQTQLLLAGIKATRPGGVLLYSTCSLSQLQNECVVEQAVSLAHQDMDISVQPLDLGDFRRVFSNTFFFATREAIGEVILPHMCANFGPIYMCKLLRLS